MMKVIRGFFVCFLKKTGIKNVKMGTLTVGKGYFPKRKPVRKRKEGMIVGVRLLLQENSMTARLSGEIDHHGARAMREEIDRTAEKMHPKTLRLDFSGVPFMDSSGIGLILGRYKKAQIWHGEVVLQNLSEPLEKVVRLSGVGGLCRIEHTAGDEGRDENE